MIITVTLNPAIDKTAYVDSLEVGKLNRLKNVVSDVGGKGINVSKTIKALKGNSRCFAVVAGDTGRMVENYLIAEEFNAFFVEADGSTRENVKVIDGQGHLTELNDEGPYVTERQMELLKMKLFRQLHKGDCIVMSGSAPRGVDKSIYAELVKEAKGKGAKVILDVDGEYFRLAIEEKPDVVKPNIAELEAYFGVSGLDENGIVEYAKKLIDKGVQLVVVSLGDQGALFVTADKVWKAEALDVEVASTVGAGDAMVAALALCMDMRLVMDDTICWCMAASAGACMTQGTKPADYLTVSGLIEKVVYHVV